MSEDEAANLEEDELARAVRDYRLAHGPDALPESEVRAMFVTEENRVADALILSELLVPRLTAPAAGAGWSAPHSPARERPVTPVRPLAGAGPPAIPDLLDAMLAAERARHHPLSSAQRVS